MVKGKPVWLGDLAIAGQAQLTPFDIVSCPFAVSHKVSCGVALYGQITAGTVGPFSMIPFSPRFIKAENNATLASSNPMTKRVTMYGILS